jgi:hypothetical protein
MTIVERRKQHTFIPGTRLAIRIDVPIWKSLPIFHAILNDIFAGEFILYLGRTTLVVTL